MVEKELSSSSHGVSHTRRVYRLCQKLADESTDEEVLLTAAILHDIAREEENNDDIGITDHALLGAEKAENILEKMGYDDRTIEEVKHCIVTHRFRSEEEPETKEAKILSDADKLDAVGAVGIARMFMLAGEFKEQLYHEVPLEEYVEENVTKEGRVRDISEHAPNLEYELKLKQIPEKLCTEEAKNIAERRMKYMEFYFSRLKKEIDGKR